jgi:hypothetical protein
MENGEFHTTLHSQFSILNYQLSSLFPDSFDGFEGFVAVAEGGEA